MAMARRRVLSLASQLLRRRLAGPPLPWRRASPRFLSSTSAAAASRPLDRLKSPPFARPARKNPASFPWDRLGGALDSERSFTDMITRGCNPAALSNNVPPPNETPASNDAPASVKGNQKRTKNFSVEEDEMLVSAWLNVSLDPVHGVDQSRSTYWKRIYDYFHGNKTFDSDRTQSSLMSRWSGIQHDVNIFAGCVSKIEARNQSGLSIDDKQANALRMFKAEDKHHRNFPYIHC